MSFLGNPRSGTNGTGECSAGRNGIEHLLEDGQASTSERRSRRHGFDRDIVVRLEDAEIGLHGNVLGGHKRTTSFPSPGEVFLDLCVVEFEWSAVEGISTGARGRYTRLRLASLLSRCNTNSSLSSCVVAH